VIAVVQRVSTGSVEVVEPRYVADIGRGIVVLVAVEPADTEVEADAMARKLAHLRIFPDDAGRMQRSVSDIGGEVLLISQFTIAGDCSRGNRPSFAGAAPPEQGRHLYERVGESLRERWRLIVRTGVFGAAMRVTIVNDGPVTIILGR